MTEEQRIKYLERHCICAPDEKKNRSVCGFPCNAKIHWREEVALFKKQLKKKSLVPNKS